MLLAIDIGNSSVVMGAYGDSDEPLATRRLPTDRRGRPEALRQALIALWQGSGFGAQDFDESALCSVVAPQTALWRGVLADVLDHEPLVLHQGMDVGLTLEVRSPDQVGMDRLVDAAAVRARTTGAAVAVDFGTATTFNVVDAGGRFRGGAIAPGLATAAESLMERAPVLLDLAREVGDQSPASTGVALVPPSSAIGRDTDEALRSGVVLGYAGLVEGLLARIRDELDTPMTVIATGGFGNIVTPLTGAIDQYDPWLTLAGIRTVYRLNAGRA
ncbi:MAG: type III pantothenate kinase [Caldilineaceae bacterium]|nr:type III pantothenate kinase [Caldilineaceae bacterium]